MNESIEDKPLTNELKQDLLKLLNLIKLGKTQYTIEDIEEGEKLRVLGVKAIDKIGEFMNQKDYIAKMDIDLRSSKSVMITYLKLKLEEQDWHAIADASMDIREIEAILGFIRMLKENDH